MLHFSFSRFFFSGENYNRSPYFLCITSSFSVVDSDKTTSWITSSCLKFCWEKVEGILSIFSDELSSSGTVFILFSRSASINFFFWTPFFIFLQTPVFGIESSIQQLNLLYHLSYCFRVLWFLYFFGCCECWLPWIR